MHERPVGRRSPSRPVALAAAALALLAACDPSRPPAHTAPAATAPAATAPAASIPAGGIPAAGWTTYQHDNARLGAAAPQPPLTPIHQAWYARLDGAAIYGQPLLAGGRVLVATEDDDVYALDPATGRTVWHLNLGVPLREVDSQAGCGDVDPLGVTSTPVVDPATGILYVVAEVSTAGHMPVQHRLSAIDIATGRIVASQDADPPLGPGQSPVSLLQRAALLLANGRVYVAYGGQYGDCGRYHGWLVALPATAHANSAASTTYFDVTPYSSGGAIWGGGSGPSAGTDGSVYVTTGNPNSGGPAPWAEAVLRLPPALGPTPLAAFQDRLASGDLDLATGGPVLLPDGTVFAVGKTDVGYLLTGAGLRPLGPVSGTVCGSSPDGGNAFAAGLDALYVPCRGGGIQQVLLSRRVTGWRAGQANSTPVLVNGDLWALAYPAGSLQELDPRTGRVLTTVAVGRPLPPFASPSAADGLLLVPTTSGLVAFTGPAGPGR